MGTEMASQGNASSRKPNRESSSSAASKSRSRSVDTVVVDVMGEGRVGSYSLITGGRSVTVGGKMGGFPTEKVVVVLIGDVVVDVTSFLRYISGI